MTLPAARQDLAGKLPTLDLTPDETAASLAQVASTCRTIAFTRAACVRRATTQPGVVAVDTLGVPTTIHCRCGRRVAATDDHDLAVDDDVVLVSVTQAKLAIACPSCGATVSCAHLADGDPPPSDSVTMPWGTSAWLVLTGATYRDRGIAQLGTGLIGESADEGWRA